MINFITSNISVLVTHPQIFMDGSNFKDPSVFVSQVTQIYLKEVPTPERPCPLLGQRCTQM